MEKTKTEYKSTWWMARLPDGWDAVENQECVTFSSRNHLGVLQISAAYKERDDVTEADLAEFAAERLGEKVALKKIKLPAFDGFYAEYVSANRSWREWWLRSSGLMLYVTFNTDKLASGERVAIDEILESLRAALPITPIT